MIDINAIIDRCLDERVAVICTSQEDVIEIVTELNKRGYIEEDDYDGAIRSFQTLCRKSGECYAFDLFDGCYEWCTDSWYRRDRFEVLDLWSVTGFSEDEIEESDMLVEEVLL